PRQVRRRDLDLGLGRGVGGGPGRVHGGGRGGAAARPGADVTPTLRPYLLVLGATLLAQGLASWALDWSGHASNQLPNRFANSDPRHAFIHVAWGAVMLLLAGRGMSDRGYAQLTRAFGLFYTALALLGLAVHH